MFGLVDQVVTNATSNELYFVQTELLSMAQKRGRLGQVEDHEAIATTKQTRPSARPPVHACMHPPHPSSEQSRLARGAGWDGIGARWIDRLCGDGMEWNGAECGVSGEALGRGPMGSPGVESVAAFGSTCECVVLSACAAETRARATEGNCKPQLQEPLPVSNLVPGQP